MVQRLACAGCLWLPDSYPLGLSFDYSVASAGSLAYVMLVFFSSTRHFTLLPSDVSSAIIALGETSVQVITFSGEVYRGFHPMARLNKCEMQADRWTWWLLWKLISKGVPHIPQKVPDRLSVPTIMMITKPSWIALVFFQFLMPDRSHNSRNGILHMTLAFYLWFLERALSPVLYNSNYIPLYDYVICNHLFIWLI